MTDWIFRHSCVNTANMKCPYCSNLDTRVIDSRPTEDNTAVRRRRVCDRCQKRFTTYERYEEQTVLVIKKDGSREPFSRQKVLNGMTKACEKRRISEEVLEKAANWVESQVHQSNEREIESIRIGEWVMEALKDVDPIAYVRFASVCREFGDIALFEDAVDTLRHS